MTQLKLGFTKRLQRTIYQALELAEGMGDETIGTQHILIALVNDRHSVAAHALRALGIDEGQVERAVDEITRERVSSPDNPDLHP